MEIEAALEGFDEFVRSTMAAWKVPGLALGIVKENEVIYLSGFGQRDVDHNLPVTPQTLFPLASGTKAFTTMAVGLLVDEGKLDWDTPVRHYLPAFKLYDPVVSERLTPRDLVTHRAGLPRHDMVWYNSSFSREELVRRLQYLEPNKDFRSVWQYQNLMYMTAGYLIEYLTGQTWEAFVQARLFQPLGMHGSNFSIEVSQAAEDYALPYKEKDEVLSQIPFYTQMAVGPAGAINTSAADMTRWLLLHLNGGVYEQQRLISEAQLRDMHMPQMVMKEPSRYAELSHSSYGLGWFIEPYRGHDFIHHGGNIDGFSTITTFMPRDNIGVVALANLSGTPAPWILCLNVYDRLLGLDQIDWTERHKKDETEMKAAEEKGKEKSDTDRVPDTQPSHPLESYVGEYEHPGYGLLSFKLVEGALQAQLNDNPFPVKHYHYDTFELLWERWDFRYKATFTTNVRGDIEAVVAPFEPTVRDIVFKRLPDRLMSDRNFLSQFLGEYEMMGFPLSIMLKGESTLLARIPGQPEVELVPRRGTEFLVKELSGYSLEFIKDEAGGVCEVIVTHPWGVFTAKKR